MSYSRRRYRSSAYGDVNWKEWHAQKRAQLSAKYGGIDDEVIEAFFNLAPSTLNNFFRSYERQHGASAGTYARKTYRDWQANQKQPSAQTLERLLALLPSFLSFEVKYELLRKLRERYRSREDHSIAVSIWNWRQQLEPIVRRVIQKAYLAQLPADVESRLRWLSSGQMQAAKQLLAEAEAQAGRLAVSRLGEEVRKIEQLLASLPAKKKDATHCITLPYGTITLTIDRRAIMDQEPKRQEDPGAQEQPTALEKVTPGSLLHNAVRNLDREQVRRVSEKAVEEGLTLEVEKARASQRFENSSRDMDEFVHQAQRLDQQRTSDYQMQGEFKTASGTTMVRVSKEGSKITIVIAVVIALILILVFMSRH